MHRLVSTMYLMLEAFHLLVLNMEDSAAKGGLDAANETLSGAGIVNQICDVPGRSDA